MQDLFSLEYGEVFHIQPPTSRERHNFFEDLILNQASRAPTSEKKAGEEQQREHVCGNRWKTFICALLPALEVYYFKALVMQFVILNKYFRKCQRFVVTLVLRTVKLNFVCASVCLPHSSVLNTLEVLPVAAPPPPYQLTEEEAKRLEEQEEDTLRELRLFLRDVTNRLSQDKRFKAFTKPVDLEEVGFQPRWCGLTGNFSTEQFFCVTVIIFVTSIFFLFSGTRLCWCHQKAHGPGNCSL